MHEASLYEDNCFITLTFNDEHLPADLSLDVKHFQDFMKRLKSSIRRKDGKEAAKRIRFYHCGEYGSLHQRPHYHACLFNFDFADKKIWKDENGIKLYRSNSLELLWPFGYSSVGDLTFESAAYVARYITKKVTGDDAGNHYERVHPISGEIYNVRPEYTTMSLKPGIGYGWFEKYSSDVYPSDFVVVRGKKMLPPKFYDKKYEISNPDEFNAIKRKRLLNSKDHADNNTTDRLKVRETVQYARFQRLRRKLEDDL